LIRELERQKKNEQASVRKYDKEIRKNSKRLSGVKVELKDTQNEVFSLENLISKRAVHVYKRGYRESLRFIAAADSPGDFFRRQLYVKKIQLRDSKNLTALRDARQRHSNKKDELENTVTRLSTAREEKSKAVKNVEDLISTTFDERTELLKDRSSLDNLLVSVRHDRKSIELQIEDKKAALKQVENWIASLEKKRISGSVQEINVSKNSAEAIVHKVKTFRNFNSSRGQMPWPVKGKVISRFGLEKNRITGTLTDNPGIDIKAKTGQEVISVLKGVCTRITYLRGFGTTVLIDHGEGYYTVYAHLDEVWVGEGENIEAGRVLGTVGSSGGVGSPRLHFQVWHKRQKQDPLKWLSS